MRRNERHGARLRLAAIAATVGAALALGACSEGYPGEDRPLVSPFDMSNAERIAELDLIGRDSRGGGSGGERWRYVLREGCQLEVELRRRGDPPVVVTATLARTMDAEVVFDAASRTYDVALLDRRGDAAAVTVGTLLKSDSWTHATQASLLVDLLIRDCARGVVAR